LRLQAFLLNSSRQPLLRYIAGPLYKVFHWRSTAREQHRRTGHILARQQAITSYVNDNLAAHLRSIGPVVQEALRFFRDQKRTQEILLERIAELSRYSEERLNEEAMQRRQEFKDRTAEIDQLRRVYNKYRTQVELTEKDLKSEMEHLFRKYQEVRTELVYQNHRLASQFGRDESASAPSPPGESAAGPTSYGRELDAFFASFDEHFRGDRETVKQRLRSYLPFILEDGAGTRDAPILDVACGRGEWLELLKQENLIASGVDFNAVLVDQCRERGLEVTQADLTDYLRRASAGSFGAVSAFHIVEHLPIERLMSFLEQALIVLRPGGLLLLETPNPQNVLVGSCNFYFDPTHRNPLPSPVLRFLVESRGFVIVETFGLNPSDENPIAGDSELAKRFNEYFYGPMDYAIVARKV
jgi:O-antigen chain-terminating methyltransferase